MKPDEVFRFQWPFLLKMLPDLETSSTDFGAIQRKRNVRSAADLLRLALVYGYCDRSLRETAAWAASTELADVSDVALLKRFRQCGAWLGHLLAHLVAERGKWRSPGNLGMPIRILDATTIAAPGSTGADWRIHLSFDLDRMTISDVLLSDPKVGESLGRMPLAANDLILADRGYAHAAELRAAAEAGAWFLIRLPWRNVPLIQPDGQPWDLMAFLRGLSDGETAAADVRLSGAGGAIHCRVLAVRKTEPAAQQSRERALRDNGRKGKDIDPRTLEAAGYTFLITNLPADRLTPDAGLELYRYRWQIELAFKRLKSLLHIDHLRAKEPKLAQTYITAKLIGALLIDELTQRHLGFSPWGFPIQSANGLNLADAASVQ